MTSGDYVPLPFSLSGIAVMPEYLSTQNLFLAQQQLRAQEVETAATAKGQKPSGSSASASASEASRLTPLPEPMNPTTLLPVNVTLPAELSVGLIGQPLQLAIQSVLSGRSVAIGDHYTELGPRVGGGVNGSLALAQIFEEIPVFGANGLGDILQGLKLHLDWNAVRGRIPVTAWLANPFSCAIAVRDIQLTVYAEPDLDPTPLGWVGMPKVEEHRGDNGYRYDVPELMPPFHHMADSLLFYNGSSNTSTAVQGVNDTSTLLWNEPARYYFQVNLGGMVGDTVDTIRQLVGTVRNREFMVSLGVERLVIRVGRLEWTMYNLTKESLANIPLFPKAIVDKVGWMPLMGMMFGPGWNLLNTQGINVFDSAGVAAPAPVAAPVSA